jgi:hypothetical protein
MTLSTKEDLQNLLQNHQRRLQVLKEQQALMGIQTPPAILIEIQDIETKIDELQVSLDQFTAPNESQHETAPLVYIHNWGKKPDKFPETPHLLDWSGPGRFQEQAGGGRSVPSAETWRDELLPRLNGLPAEIGAAGWVRLAGQCALSTGFAFGHVFRAKERFQIELAQFIPGAGPEYWSSAAPLPEQIEAPKLTPLTAISHTAGTGSAPTKNEAVIVVAAIKDKSVTVILSDVGTYFGEAEAFSQIPDGNTQFQAVKGVLLLEAETATRQKRNLAVWEAVALAQSSAYRVNEFKAQVEPEKLHLFMAAPLGLAVFMGHYWNHVRCPVQCYEETRTDRFYAPSCEVAVN